MIIKNFTPIRGWIYDVSIEEDSEGPTYFIKMAYEHNEKILLFQYEKGYDSYHWSLSYPEHYDWFISKMKEGNSLTLMINPENHEDLRIFGQLEVFSLVDSKPEWIAT